MPIKVEKLSSIYSYISIYTYKVKDCLEIIRETKS
jgi:hypothetical protein